ncbi:MAG: cation:proton antiporter [Candidatus Nanopelagicaceae bacterium]|nr:cation:proton antiporter [Candidatus Nanopelagicaceae bacterium]
MIEVAASLTKEDGLVLGELGSVLVGLGLAVYLASRLRFSVVPIFLIAGLFFGNGGIVDLSFSDNFLNLGAQWGAILLLLMLGLEYSAEELFDSVKQRKSLGFVDLVLNFMPGLIFGFILGWGWMGALALGGITYVSSSGIAAQFIKDLRLEANESTKRAVSVLVIEDLFLAPYLPILSAVLASLGAVSGLISVSIALIITGIALLIGARGIHIPHAPLIMGDTATVLLTVFGSALLASGVATYYGFSGAVAAFLVGLLLTGDVAIVARVRLAPLRDLFSAIFFLFFGLSTNPADIPQVFIPALILSFIGVGTKWLTAWWAVRDLQEEKATLRAAVLLTPRGEFSMVIAGLAATTSFSVELQTLTLTYVILTTLAASFFSKSASTK